MPARKPAHTPDPPMQTEAEQIAAAPVVEAPQTQTIVSADEALKARVTEIMSDQFGGEDGEPKEGVTKWNDMVRQQVIEADSLATQRESIYKKQEANRTLLRAFRDMEQIPGDVVEYFYTTRVRKTKAQKEAEKTANAPADDA